MPYIGIKGYSIKKKQFSPTELYNIRNELNVKPYNNMNGYATTSSYPIFRESENKLYLPRYYGIEKFGPCDKIILPHGNSIQLSFKGNLFDYQTNIIEKYLNHVKDSGGGLLDVEPGKGKTVMGLNIISKLKKKTLVVVHKTFLLNQWKERIEQFLPGANVGLIQGQIIDTKDKDIVIGMLQTLSTKDLSRDIIEEFGLTIYDECHHLSAEVFSNVMIKINTNHILGLSGTMTRKDGLTKVFKYFVGPVIHKEKSENKTEVLIKSILFEDPTNEEYNEIETDFKGNVMYSRMITKICNNENRTNMIVNIIHYELKKNYNQQIMILAHNKTLIKELYEKISVFEKDIGYYLGGMKEKQLKESESKKIIIATYAMASEGLDIKTLTTLCMATPKSDVCQSIGRILRGSNTNPFVIDVIDDHDIFKRQFKKRSVYYKKKKFIIQKYLNLNCYLKDEFENEVKHQQNNKCLIKIPDCVS